MSEPIRHRTPWLAPILPGATTRDRLIACLGALLGIGITGVLSAVVVPGVSTPLLVAPIGASAVLLFAVPASPLAQPWSIIGGNTISALVGITVGRLVPDVSLAAGFAVALAIGAMSACRCLHPPGGAAALTAVVGGPAVLAAGYRFALEPMLLNSALLVALGWVFHRLSRHSYPHRAVPAVAPTALAPRFSDEDLDLALAELGEGLDISREDLEAVIRRVEFHAGERRQR